jgi:phenylalanyl-tRNA synthetase beta chain
VRLFEVGRVFRRAPEVEEGPFTVAGIDQPVNVAGLAYGPAESLQWNLRERSVDFYDAKGDVEALLAPARPTFKPTRHPALHPGRAAEVWLDGERIGVVGELHPRWRQAYELPQAPVLFELSLAALQRLEVPKFEPVARQQAVQRDIALIVSPEVTHDALMAALTDDDSGILRQALLFDVYRPSQAVAGMAMGERSLAVRLELLDEAATLSDERIEALVQAAVARAAHRLGARLRG